LKFKLSRYKVYFFYTASYLFNAGCSFIVFSYLTKQLSQQDYGVISLYSSAIAFVLPFISLGSQFALNVDYFRFNKFDYRIKYNNSISLMFISASICTVIFLLLYRLVEKYFSLNVYLILLIPALAFFTLFIDILLTHVRNEKNHSIYLIISVSKNIIEIIFIILLFSLFSYTAEYRILSSAITLILFFILSIIYLKKITFWDIQFNPKYSISLIKEGIPFIPERLSIFMISFLDRFLIHYYSGIENVGIYSVAFQLAYVVSILTMILISIYQPILFNLMASKANVSQSLKNHFYKYLSILFIFSLFLTLIMRLLFQLFIGENFIDAYSSSIMLIISNFIAGIYAITNTILLYTKKNNVIMFISITGMIISFTLNVVMIRAFGYSGAAISSILVNSTMLILSIYNINRFLPLKSIFMSNSTVNI
jgi:O-antigen/teichoic acid export membrane protein